VLIALVLAAHFWDLGIDHDRSFVDSFVYLPGRDDHDGEFFKSLVGQQRISVDYAMGAGFNRQIDDVGVFDSILLARPYRAFQDTAGMPPSFNTQVLAGGPIAPRALRFFGVRCVVTPLSRTDLPVIVSNGTISAYDVADPIPRASIVPLSDARFVDVDEIHRDLRDVNFDLSSNLLLPPDAARPAEGPAQQIKSRVEYRHDSTDRFSATVSSPTAGYLRLLETWDPGWRATIDGRSAPLICAYDCFMAIPISPGEHDVQLQYSTPGAHLGVGLSLFSGLALLCLIGFAYKTGRS